MMNSREVVALYPLMPTKYSPQKRKELRKFEKELLEGKNIMLKKSEVILNAGKPKPQTNEEWFNGLSTETKARITHLVYMAGYRDGCNKVETLSLQDIMEWLKQNHTNREEKHNEMSSM